MVFTLRKKLYIGFSAIIVLFVITVVLSTILSQRMIELTIESTATEERMEVIQRLNLFARTANDNGAHYLLAPLYVEEDFESQFRSNVQYVGSELALLSAITTDPEGSIQIANFKRKWAAFVKKKQQIMALKKQGNTEQAQENYTKDSFDPIAFALHAFFKTEQARLLRYNGEIRSSGRIIQWADYSVASFAIVLSLGVAYFLSNYLVERIQRLKGSAQMVAEGDLQVPDLAFNGRDELQDLAQAFNRMTHSLRSVIDSNQSLQHLSTRDGLTGIPNRRCYDETIEREWSQPAGNAKPISLILFDIDYFKRYNDFYGHQEGDECLRQVAGILQEQVGPYGLAARYGGEEFIVLLPNQTADEAVQMAASFKQALAQRAIPHEKSEVSDYVTVSIGVASTAADRAHTPKDLLKETDEALYEAKETGRDRICVYGRGVQSQDGDAAR
ncbi:diguanylate cyclase (GGDEF)-like protein [Paenibacillus phyllosphaerae]|uniref:Diguanylate cyclase (GGDEF)-like protein n=1 Tax=Paenibacillus phyllosphaerae TaxID=274593 RepID=A0A7W5FRB4_9BACL|nr:diguanylate cyclase [Paenibacillus phyllosphaerae]MBB3114356.1 diguanylate cyclase (GGDEF)-like protein [Paenibacillus phyllosphaerae]